MEFLGQINNVKDITTKEYVQEYVASTGGWINSIKVDGAALPIAPDKSVNIINKADKEIAGQNGTSSILNVTDGAQLRFVNNDGTISTIRVKDSGDNGEVASISAINGAGTKSAKLVVRTDGIYAIQDKTTIDPENDLVATLGNIPYPYFSAVKKETPTEGYFATYYIADKKGDQCGVDINIPKDFLVKKAEMKYCVEEGVPLPELHVGDPYIDLTINVKEGSQEESHLYINVKNLVDIYTAGNGITVVDNVISAKVVEQNGISVTTDGIKMDLVSTTTNGAMSAGQAEKLDGIEALAQVNKIESVSADNFVISAAKELDVVSGKQLMTTAQVEKLDGITPEAKKVEASLTNGNIKINGVETNVFTHVAGSQPNVAKKLYKFGTDGTSHIDEIEEVTDVGDYLSFGTAYNRTSNKAATMEDISHATIDAATQTWVKNQGYLLPIDIAGKADTSYVNTEVTRVEGKIPSLTGYATEAWVESKHYLTEHQSLADYAQKAQVAIDIAAAKDAAKTETQAWVESKNYLTEHQDISGKANTSDLTVHTNNTDIHVTAADKTAWTAMGTFGTDITVTKDVGGYHVGDTISSTDTWQSIITKLLASE